MTHQLEFTEAELLSYQVETVYATAGKPTSWFRDDLAPEFMADATLATRGTVRAVERGRRARIHRDNETGQIDGWLVKSDTAGQSYKVTIQQCHRTGVHFGCNCQSGIHRPGQPVPCFHAAAVGASLVRRGLLDQEANSGLFVPTALAIQLGGVHEPANTVEDDFARFARQ